MKCPKCHYLGFETGDRCRNCGYDFSLLNDDAAASECEPELPLHGRLPEHPAIDLPLNASATPDPIDSPLQTAIKMPAAAGIARDLRLDDDEPAAPAGAVLHVEPVLPAPSPRATPLDGLAPMRSASAHKWQDRSLPLFAPSSDDEDDTPLVRLPAAPRAPLAVRRTPDNPRLRALARPATTPDVEAGPDLRLADASGEPAAAVPIRREHERRTDSQVWRQSGTTLSAGGSVRRLGAALIDHALLLSVDVVVIYFTLRMVGAEVSDWTLLPRPPLALFLTLIKLAYFGVFTAMGGQTIGKMATRIRVVTEDGLDLGAAQTARRTLAGALTAFTLGLGFVPGLVGERRALHDRVARTRVVGLEPA
jgi:uncharacterized RDD family membrane protein YckC